MSVVRVCCVIQIIVFILIIAVTFAKAAIPGARNDTYATSENWFDQIDAEPFVRIGSKYYLFETKTKANWYDAAHICRTHHANLATIENAADFQAITDYIVRERFEPSNFYWLAYNDLRREGDFYSIGTGLPMKFQRFSSGNPDNAFNVEHCVHIWYHKETFSWNDLDCKLLAHYICQADNPRLISFTVW